MAESNLQFILSAQDRVTSQIAKVNDSMKGLGTTTKETSKSTQGLTSDFKNFTQAFIVGNAIFSIATDAALKFKEGIRAANDENDKIQASQGQINVLLKNTGDVSGQTTESINKMAEATAKVTPITKEATLAAAEMLIPFTAISKDQFPRVMQAADDLATHMNNGLAPSADMVASAAKQLGVAMTDPEKGLGRLKKAGIALTIQQQDAIKVAEESGNLTKAQNLLLQDLSDTMGGSAYAAGQTFSGQMTILKNNLVDLEASGINRVKNALTDLFNDFENNRDEIAKVVDEVENYLAPSFEALWHTIDQKVLPVLNKLWHEVIEPLLPVIGILLVGAVKLVTDGLNLLLSAVTPVINWMLNNKGVVVAFAAAFGVLMAALNFSRAFDALDVGFATLTQIKIPYAMTRVAAFQTLVSTPMVMGAIAVGAALLAIGAVYDKISQTKALLDNINNDIVANNNSDTSAMQQVIASYKAGKITKAQYQNFFQSISQRASGGPVNAGQPYIVGEQGQELFVPNTSGTIVPNNKLASSGSGAPNVSLSVNMGMYAGLPSEKRKIAVDLYREVVREARSHNVQLPQIGSASPQ